jgi:hypothetical protein
MLHGKFSGIRRITCAGYTEATKSAFTDYVVASQRATTVCDYLVRSTKIGESTSATSAVRIRRWSALGPCGVRRAHR